MRQFQFELIVEFLTNESCDEPEKIAVVGYGRNDELDVVGQVGEQPLLHMLEVVRIQLIKGVEEKNDRLQGIDLVQFAQFVENELAEGDNVVAARVQAVVVCRIGTTVRCHQIENVVELQGYRRVRLVDARCLRSGAQEAGDQNVTLRILDPSGDLSKILFLNRRRLFLDI